MATLETQQLDEIIVNSRRKMLALGGAALAGLAFAGVKFAEAQSSPAYTDSDILNFALNLEYLEVEVLHARHGRQDHRSDGCRNRCRHMPSPAALGGHEARGPGSCLVPWTIPAMQAYATETARKSATMSPSCAARWAAPQWRNRISTSTTASNFGQRCRNRKHIRSLRERSGVPHWRIHLRGCRRHRIQRGCSFANVRRRIWLRLPAFWRLRLTMQAWSALASSLWTRLGKGLQGYTQKISATRMALDGSSTTDDIGVGFQNVDLRADWQTNRAATIVDAQTGSPNYSKTYSRTTTQVLRLSPAARTDPSGAKYMGVFFPNGLNGLFS